MSAIAFLRQLLEDGLALDDALMAADRFEQRAASAERARIAERRVKDAARKQAQRQRESHAMSRGQAVTSSDTHGPSPHGSECAQVVTPSLPSLRSEEVEEPPVKPNGLTAPKGAETSRGTRLPDAWRPDEAGLNYAIDQLGPDVDPEREIDRFRDYWRAIPGAKARKADWPATWRNWVRRASETLPRKAPHDLNRSSPPSDRSASRTRVWTEAAAIAGRARSGGQP